MKIVDYELTDIEKLKLEYKIRLDTLVFLTLNNDYFK